MTPQNLTETGNALAIPCSNSQPVPHQKKNNASLSMQLRKTSAMIELCVLCPTAVTSNLWRIYAMKAHTYNPTIGILAT